MPEDALAALAIVIVVVYLVSDPPYPGGARKYSRRYRHDDHDRDHVALRGLLQALPCTEMVSGPPSALYDQLLDGWRSASLQVMNRAGAGHREGVVQFRAGPAAPDGARGRDSTHRETVKRKAANWSRRYRAMTPTERLAVLAADLAVEAQP
ncbi:MAG: hypothetical protein OXP09_16720 [Gammaproteobacteria bacterium]|nr:hypothetical protein [Gammaproteobacteria bacterium]